MPPLQPGGSDMGLFANKTLGWESIIVRWIFEFLSLQKFSVLIFFYSRKTK